MSLHRLVIALLIAVAVGLPTAAQAEALLALDDPDGPQVPWPGTALTSDPVHSGRRALRWVVADKPILDSPRLMQDWTAFDELRFWAYLDKPTDFSIPLIFASEGGYYITDWKLDWQGWKEHRFPLADCRPAHEPVGWHRISHFGFRAQGYGQPPVPEGLTLVFDDFALHSAADLPYTRLADWLAADRRERIKAMKARGNPYFLSVLDGLAHVGPEPSLPTTLTSPWQFSGLASQALAAAWAAGWQDSPRRGDQTLIAHASALVNFCLAQQKEGSWFYSRRWEAGGDPNSDRFALGPLMDAVYWLRLLPEGEQAWPRWEAPLRELVDFQYTHWGRRSGHAWSDSAGRYPNQDVFHLAEMALAHRFWGDDRYLASARDMLDGLEAHLLPDGGLNYIGPETEIPCYHDLNVYWIARYYDLTGDERARDLLALTVAYYPLTYSDEGRPEYYTDCWWKHYWSDGSAGGPEIIAGITGDPHNKWLADRLLERVGPGDSYRAIYAGLFYRDDIEPQPLPDSCLRFDRNIGGPRGRFGSWYFAGVTGGGARDTFVGAMVCDPARADPLNGAFLAASIEVGLGGEGPRHRTALYTSGPDDLTDVALAGEAAAVAARYSPRAPYINSVPDPKVPPTPWRATQLWLLTRHGLLGLVELEATEEQTVPRLAGELRFGPTLPLVHDQAQGLFRCGPVTLRLLEHTFAAVEAGPARPPYARSSTTHSAVLLTTPGDSFTARPGQPVRYVALVSPEGAAARAECTRFGAGDLFGFTANLGDEPFAVAFNAGDAAVEAQVPWGPGEAALWRGQGPSHPARPTDGRLRLTLDPRALVLVTRAP